LLLASGPRTGGVYDKIRMWKFLLDPRVQSVAFVVAFAAIGFVAWDLYDDARDPAPTPSPARRRRERPRPSEASRLRFQAEPSVEIWTDSAGETRGRVRRGPCRGMRLEDMSREQCGAQAAYARDHDPAATAVLEGYIRLRFGHERRYEPQPQEGMTRAEALAELGLREDAGEADIHSAYRKLIMKHHPDHGGSHAKAARLNQAKDLLSG
jgi:DnaJ domain